MWSTETVTSWIDGSGKRYTSGKNKTSPWIETRSPINFHTSMITYCLPQRHLVDSRSDEGGSCCQNVTNKKGCIIDKYMIYQVIASTCEYLQRFCELISIHTGICLLSRLCSKPLWQRNLACSRLISNLVLCYSSASLQLDTTFWSLSVHEFKQTMLL